MSVREGYKHTEIGMIPEEWEVAEQGAVATFYNGRAYKLTEWEEHGTPVIRLQNLTGSGENYYYSNLNLPDHQYCHNGDLLYMWSATFGPVWWKGDKAIFHYHIWKIDTQTDRLDKNFLFYLLDQITTRMKKQSHGSTMIHVTKGGMEKLKIQLPPLQEQQKIAEILSTVDQKIDSIDSKIEETQTLKRGLMQRLLSEGIGHSEFKESEIGRIPTGWEVARIGDIGTLSKGKGIAKSEVIESGLPCIRYGEIYTKHDFAIKKFHSFINDMSAENSRKIYKNEVLFAGSGETVEDIGKAVVYLGEQEAYAGGDIVILTPKSAYGLFLSYVVNSFEPTVKQRRKQGQGNAVVHIYAKGLATVQVPLPPIEEQKQIAEILSTTDEKLETLRAKKEAFETLKKGLMQKLLTGEVRV